MNIYVEKWQNIDENPQINEFIVSKDKVFGKKTFHFIGRYSTSNGLSSNFSQCPD